MHHKQNASVTMGLESRHFWFAFAIKVISFQPSAPNLLSTSIIASWTLSPSRPGFLLLSDLYSRHPDSSSLENRASMSKRANAYASVHALCSDCLSAGKEYHNYIGVRMNMLIVRTLTISSDVTATLASSTGCDLFSIRSILASITSHKGFSTVQI